MQCKRKEVGHFLFPPLPSFLLFRVRVFPSWPALPSPFCRELRSSLSSLLPALCMSGVNCCSSEFSSSSEEEEDDQTHGGRGGQEDEVIEGQEEALRELEEREAEMKNVEMGPPSNRLAVLGLDWDHVRAVDLFVLFASFVPQNGAVLDVTVYLSDLGMKRMQQEDALGPQGIWSKKDQELREQIRQHQQQQHSSSRQKDRSLSAPSSSPSLPSSSSSLSSSISSSKQHQQPRNRTGIEREDSAPIHDHDEDDDLDEDDPEKLLSYLRGDDRAGRRGIRSIQTSTLWKRQTQVCASLSFPFFATLFSQTSWILLSSSLLP